MVILVEIDHCLLLGEEIEVFQLFSIFKDHILLRAQGRKVEQLLILL